MLSLQRITILFLLLISTSVTWSQPYDWSPKAKPYTWAFGVSWNFVEDDGREFCQPFDVKQSWNGLAYPTRLTVERRFKYGLSAEFAGAYNFYKTGKLINSSTDKSGMFLSFDLNCKYGFYKMINIPWLDPYASLGFGVTQRNALDEKFSLTGNVAFGSNFWIYKGFGINIQTSGKIGVISEFLGSSDYFQHSIGIVYKLSPKSGGDNNFDKKRYKWTGKKERYKPSRKAG
jgi:hypothetical protein